MVLGPEDFAALEALLTDVTEAVMEEEVPGEKYDEGEEEEMRNESPLHGDAAANMPDPYLNALPEKVAPPKRLRPPTYSYPWPRDRAPEEGPPRFISYETYIRAAELVEAETRITYKNRIAAAFGVNHDTCLRLLPYWDVVRSFAMDILHDIYLGPVRAALEETFGRANISDKDRQNLAHCLRLPTLVGALISNVYTSLDKQMPIERKLRLQPPHSKHQYYKGTT
jgi:hypothetical protein